MRITLLLAMAAVFSAGGSTLFQTHAYAQSCSALKAQLAAASRVGNNAQYRRYNDALNKQRRELSRATSLFENSCASQGLNGQCRNLSITIRQMQSNVVKLQRQRDRFSNNQLNNTERRRLEARIDRACSGRSVTVVARRGDTPRPVIQDVAPQRPSTNTPLAVEPLIAPTTYRTLCVREDDGYYFPISFASREQNFSRDAAVCKAMCPAVEVELYTYPTGDDDGVNIMVSLSGQAYVDQPYAFAYRTSPKTKRGVCGTPDMSKLQALGYIQKGDEITGVGPRELETTKYPTIKNRPDRFTDPETEGNKLAKLSPGNVRELLDEPAESEPVAVSRANTNVRVVLPELLPDPATAIDLAAPAPTSVQ
ncbi:MAG: DUF2865 domain-containing protein [Pseudomonadota bacterium]